MTDRKLVVFADYVCPYCYLAEILLARLRAARGVQVEGAAFELRPPGTPLPAAHEPWPGEAWQRSVQPLARELAVALEYPRLATRTRKAHEAVAFAAEHGAADALRHAIYEAYWLEGRDIGRIDVLTGLAAGVGLEPMALKVALDIDQCTAQVEHDEARAAQLGVHGVPAYLLHEGGVPVALRLGLQHHDELDDWVMGRL